MEIPQDEKNETPLIRKALGIAIIALVLGASAFMVVADKTETLYTPSVSTTTLPASNITLTDNDNYYTSENVEGALKQLYENLLAGGGSLVVTTTNQTANRALETLYQNTTGKPLYVSITGFFGETISAWIGATSDPNLPVDLITPSSHYDCFGLHFLVPPNWYYYVFSEAAAIDFWIEQTLEIVGGGGGGTSGGADNDDNIWVAIDNLTGVLDNQIIRIDNLTAVCDDYGGDLDNYRGQIDNLRAVADNLKTRIDNCQTHVDNLRTNMDNVRTVVDNLRGAADNLKTRVDNYQTHIDNLRATCDNFKAENTRIWTAITGDNAIHIADNTAVWAAINALPTGTIAALVASIDLSRTMTNIGATYKDIYSTAFDGEMSPINFTNATQFRILFMWDYVGSGTQNVQWADAGNSSVLWTSANMSADQDPADSGWVAIPAAFVDAENWIEWQGKSTTAGDDPIAKGYRIYLR